MSVIMTMRVTGDPAKLEALAAERHDELIGITERAKEAGVIAHRFYGSEGKVMVVDEWPDAESFQRFFERERSHIEPLLKAVATSEPEIVFWTKVETGDDVGWD
jgi:quinol monooxygenase YgiN